jgi:hypothetical protein
MAGRLNNFSRTEIAPRVSLDSGRRDPKRKKIVGGFLVVSIIFTEKPLLANSNAKLHARTDFSTRRVFEQKRKDEARRP